MGENTLIISLILFNVVLLAFVGGIVVFIQQYRIKKKTHEQELEIADMLHKEELLQTQVEIQSQTMKHIGREIHDNVGQKLTLSGLYLQQLLIDEKNHHIQENIHQVNDIINDSLQELRHLSKSLTDDTLHNPITELLQQECEKVNTLKQCKVHFQSDADIDISSYQIKSVLLRITQEFLQNSIKHAQCNTIDIQLSKEDKTIILTLKDDGIGFDINKLKSTGIGLKNMRKRTEMIQGIFILESKPKKGTQLTLKIPNS
jgi:signal transduction histidine kinase